MDLLCCPLTLGFGFRRKFGYQKEHQSFQFQMCLVLNDVYAFMNVWKHGVFIQIVKSPPYSRRGKDKYTFEEKQTQ